MKLDGKVGIYSGKWVYYCDPKDYFKDIKAKIEHDNSDYIFVMTDTNYMVHHGIIIGKLFGGCKVEQWNTAANIDDFYDMKKFASAANDDDDDDSVHEVTKRHTVEWYMNHTIKILKDGVNYGEQRLRELSEIRSVGK